MLAPVSGHLRPTAQIARDVILPGDPGRALALAQELLDSPRMSNHSRGLWGYSGRTASGRPLTIQATGIGGPSLAVVVSELAEHGAQRMIRLGTCRGLDPAIEAGEALVVGAAMAAEGASRALGANGIVEPDGQLTAALRLSAGGFSREACVISTDLLYGDLDAEATEHPDGPRPSAADLGTATLFTLGRRPGLAVAAALVVTGAGDERLGDERLGEISLRLGGAAVAALAAGE
jgi:uridine phosphorylase